MDEFAYQLNPGTDPERVKSCTLESLLKLRSSRPCSYRLDSETIILSKSLAEASQETVLDIIRAFTGYSERRVRVFQKNLAKCSQRILDSFVSNESAYTSNRHIALLKGHSFSWSRIMSWEYG